MKYVLFALMSLFIVGCNYVPDRIVGVENLTIRITDYDPPKHFYVDFDVINSDAKDSYYVGKHFERVYVSKHCNGVRGSGIIGGEAVIRVIRYTNDSEPNKVYYRFEARDGVNSVYGRYCG